MDSMSLADKIGFGLDEILTTYEDEEGYVHFFKKEDEEQIHLLTALTSFLSEHNIHYNCEILSSDCCDYSAVCIAYIVDGKLDTYNFGVEF